MINKKNYNFFYFLAQMNTIAHIFHLQHKQSIEQKVIFFRNNNLTQENENYNNKIKMQITIIK
jgi:hypothetical protein